MRKGVCVCGANGERGFVLEKVIEEFSKKNQSLIVQFSVCSIAVSPLMLSMSGVDMNRLVTINGCRNRCADRILEKSGQRSSRSCVLDDALQREIGPCKISCDYSFDDPSEDEIKRFVSICTKALD